MRRVLVLTLLLAAVAPACGVSSRTAAPGCGSTERVAILAQAVPTAGYVPCVRALRQGWKVTAFSVRNGSAHLSLLSDRSGGHPVDVTLTASCDDTGAIPATPRADGVRSSMLLRSVSPLYAGTMYDVFSGGCVRYSFAFPRGPHIPLLEDLTASVALVRRIDLRVAVHKRLGVELDP